MLHMKIELVRAVAYLTAGLVLVVSGAATAALGLTNLIVADQDCYSLLSDEGPCLVAHEVAKASGVGFLVAAGVLLVGGAVLLSMVRRAVESVK